MRQPTSEVHYILRKHMTDVSSTVALLGSSS